jgi:ubiquinol-cytochrome c reductase iron-sulfur subunit
VDAAADTFLAGLNETIGSRRGMLGLFAGALGALAVALVFPLRSLLPQGIEAGDVATTNWRRGKRLVREDGRLVHASDLEVNSVVTVFPEGFTGAQNSDAMANDATVVVRVPPQELHLPADRTAWAPDGLIAFSKVCTHAGCPVALYRAAARQLFCPCHQSTFDVLAGGKRIFGPAARGLPQLPLEIAADGTLTAAGSYPEPIGPGYWERA